METTNIYILIDPENQQVRYVGKANNISERYKAHLNRARKHQIHKLNWINSLRKKGLKPIIEVIDIVPINDWVFWETYWIAQFKAWGFKLVNYTTKPAMNKKLVVAFALLMGLFLGILIAIIKEFSKTLDLKSLKNRG